MAVRGLVGHRAWMVGASVASVVVVGSICAGAGISPGTASGSPPAPPPNSVWTGTAHGAVADFVHRDNRSPDPNTHIVSDGPSLYGADLSYQFTIDSGGGISGSGKGSYTLATWHLVGTNGRYGRFDCSPPVKGSPFTVSVSGTATGTANRPNSTLHLVFQLSGAQETNADYNCGARYTGFATSTTHISDSLQAVQGGQGLTFVNAAGATAAVTLSTTLTKREGPTTSGEFTISTESRWEIQIATPGCDLIAKAISEYQAADELFLAGDKQLQETHDEFIKWRNEEAGEFVKISVEKFTLLKLLEALSHDVAAGAEIVAIYTGPLLTAEWILIDVVPAINEHDAGLAQARAFTAQGSAEADKALANLKTALAQEPACQAAEKQIAADERLTERAKALIDSWEINGRDLYLSPSKHELLDEQAAMAEAKKILTGSRSPQATADHSRAARGIRVRKRQVVAALALVRKATRLQTQAMAIQDTALRKANTLRTKLAALMP